MLGMSKFLGNLFTGEPFRTSQDDPAPVRERPLRLVLAQLRFQKTPLLVAEFNRNRRPTPHFHHPDLPQTNDGKFSSG
jgi:hypothetical protein